MSSGQNLTWQDYWQHQQPVSHGNSALNEGRISGFLVFPPYFTCRKKGGGQWEAGREINKWKSRAQTSLCRRTTLQTEPFTPLFIVPWIPLRTFSTTPPDLGHNPFYNSPGVSIYRDTRLQRLSERRQVSRRGPSSLPDQKHAAQAPRAPGTKCHGGWYPCPRRAMLFFSCFSFTAQKVASLPGHSFHLAVSVCRSRNFRCVPLPHQQRQQDRKSVV